MVPRRGMQPYIARDSGQVDPRRSTTDILPPQSAAQARTRPSPRSPEATEATTH